MKLSRLKGLLSGVTLVVFTAGCFQGTKSSRIDQPWINRIESPQQKLRAQILVLTETDATRLHPEVVKGLLEKEDKSEQFKEAYDLALYSDSEQTRLDLIRAMELEFILDPETSVIDLLGPELQEHFRGFEWEYGDYPGGPDGPNETLADIMVDALDVIRPERRANRTDDSVIVREEATEEIWEYLTNQWTKIPGEDKWMLNKYAVDSYVRMREQAAKEGVVLSIKSAHRLREVAERNAAKAGNPAAVASFSSHSLGLAVDFQMSQEGLEFAEVTTRPMAEVVRMRQSPVHKWLFLRGDEFGWYPYQNEPWHWEYNPPGFRPIFWQDFPGGAPDRD